MGLRNTLIKEVVRYRASRMARAGWSPKVWRQFIEQSCRAIGRPRGLRLAPANGASVPATWVGFEGAPQDAAVLYCHGGGYAGGSARAYVGLAGHIARAAGVRALVFDYRLAPEHPFPAAVEDARAVYSWLLDSGVAPSRIALAGDSAGGGLALATALAARQHGVALPAAMVLLSPWTDLTSGGASVHARAARDPLLSPESLEVFAGRYLGKHDRQDPLASPLFADLAGLPPTLIQVGSDEVLFDDASRLAARAREAGVQVELQEWPEMMHVFQLCARLLPEGRRAIAQIGQFIAAQVARRA
jgi:acetyl esterase/lipase